MENGKVKIFLKKYLYGRLAAARGVAHVYVENYSMET